MLGKTKLAVLTLAVASLSAIAVQGFGLLRAQQQADPGTLRLTPYHASGIYEVGEKVGWTLSIADGATPPTAPIPYEVKKNNSETIKSGEVNLSTGPAKIEVSADEPAMLYIRLTPPTPRRRADGSARSSSPRTGCRRSNRTNEARPNRSPARRLRYILGR